MQNQLERLLLQIAEARRMHGISERDGTIHEVYRKDGEQKVRVNMGMRPDGSPWLSPWLKVEDHHGSARHQKKWHKGMNVKVSTVGADMLKATVKPHGENKDHPEPDHADDKHETEQYDKQRSRRGPDFEERWLADTSSLGLASGVVGQGQSSTNSEQKDPDKVSVVLSRWGAKPQDDQDKLQPWEGPPPTGGSAQKRHLTWAGTAGNTPTQNGDAVVNQFDKNVKTEHTADHVLQKVQSNDGQAMPIPDTKDAGSAIQVTINHMVDGVVTHLIHNTALNKVMSAIHTNGSITHTVQDADGNVSTIVQQAQQMIHQIKGQDGFSVITQGSGQIMHQVGSSVLQILNSEINLSASEVNVNGVAISGYTQPPVTPDAFNGNDPDLLGTLWPIGATLVASVGLIDYGTHPPVLGTIWSISSLLAPNALLKSQVTPRTIWPITALLAPRAGLSAFGTGRTNWAITAHFAPSAALVAQIIKRTTWLASAVLAPASTVAATAVISSPGASPVVTGQTSTVDLPAVGGAAITTMSATNSPTSWSITAGNPNNSFSIDNAGHVTVAAGLGTAPAGTHNLTVQATNASGSGTATLTLNCSMPAPSQSGLSTTYPKTKLTMQDQFTGTTLNSSVWYTNMGDSQYGTWMDAGKLPSPYSAVQNDGAGQFDIEYGDPAQVNVNYGLKLTAVRSSRFAGQTNGTQNYTWAAGYVRTVNQSLFGGGYVQVLAKQPDCSTGFWPGIWFMNGGGEIDLQEAGYTQNGTPNRSIAANVHTGGNGQAIIDSGKDLSAGYHIYGLEYVPGVSVKVYLDGVLIATFTSSIPTGAYEMLMTFQVFNTTTTGWHTNSSGSTPSPGEYDIAEVQIYHT